MAWLGKIKRQRGSMKAHEAKWQNRRALREQDKEMVAEQTPDARRWTAESGQGRLDVDGTEWFACDPYPTWYRYDGPQLFTRDYDSPAWADESESNE